VFIRGRIDLFTPSHHAARAEFFFFRESRRPPGQNFKESPRPVTSSQVPAAPISRTEMEKNRPTCHSKPHAMHNRAQSGPSGFATIRLDKPIPNHRPVISPVGFSIRVHPCSFVADFSRLLTPNRPTTHNCAQSRPTSSFFRAPSHRRPPNCHPVTTPPVIIFIGVQMRSSTAGTIFSRFLTAPHQPSIMPNPAQPAPEPPHPPKPRLSLSVSIRVHPCSFVALSRSRPFAAPEFFKRGFHE
jgi:hypothetical protein